MSVMPNSHEALLRNRHLLGGRLAIIGASSPALLAGLPVGGLLVSEHAGHADTLAGHASWRVCYGYNPDEASAGSFDTVVVFLPKARAELDLRLAFARWLSASGARLILVGEKKEGIAGAVKQLKGDAPGAVKVDSARHCQVWCAEDITPLEAFQLEKWMAWHTIASAGVSVEVAGLPGIFSQGQLDEGTRVLLETLASTPVKAGRVLDFACGAGVIGAWMQTWQGSQGFAPAVVDGIDVQFQAVTCARATYDRASATGVITASDGLAGANGVWPAIVTNPPFHTGVKVDTSIVENFFRDISRHLERRGELRLVANSFLPYESLIKRFIGPVERLSEGPRFTVYRAFRR
jgi:16S rRNA (guanine1207-N2)-methyltransferase